VKEMGMKHPVWVKKTAAAMASGSSGTRSEMSEVSSVDTTSIIDDLLGIMAQVYDQMETGMDDNTI
jgi:hypothetical protein